MPYVPFAPKTEKSSVTHKLLGVYIDKDLSHFLHLYALYQDRPLSEIVRELLNDYVKTIEDQRTILATISELAHDEWKEWYLKNNGLAGWRNAEQVSNRWDDFKKEAINNLKKRKIPASVITEIIDMMEKLEIQDKTEDIGD